jgi:uncharacterized membrane protein YqgA involved in biofilm formation
MTTIKLKEASRDAFLGTIAFILTFILGSIIDLGFHKLYKLIDKDEKNEILLFIIFFVQMFIIVLFVSLINQYQWNITIVYFLRMGLIVSQIFALQFALKRLSDKINGRDPSKRLYSLHL